MTLKEIIMNGQLKRVRPTVEHIEAVTTTVRTMAISSQQVLVTLTIRPVAPTTIQPAPHFTCSAESCYESKIADKLSVNCQAKFNKNSHIKLSNW